VRFLVSCHNSTDNLWSPHSVSTGIGGSEEAVIHVAAGLANRGHEVIVVNARTGPARRLGGVTWTSYATLERHLGHAGPADIGIVWRRPWRVDVLRGLARRFYLWLHDFIPEANVLSRLDAFVKIIVLSRFHRLRFPSIPANRIFVTANGVDSEGLPDNERRHSQRMVYGSCYSRGLAILLENWPRIRAAAPGASLNIFYGWQTMRQNSPERYQRLRAALEPQMAQEGITHLGRVGHGEVARQYAAAGVWAYPCVFPETSCISAMKAQAGGAVPAVIASGALAETVRYGFKTMRGSTDFVGRPLPGRIVEEWLEGLIDLIRAPDRQARIRREMIPDCRHRFAWSGVVDQWEGEFQPG
jgi:protein O-GlcNAc transferase